MTGEQERVIKSYRILSVLIIFAFMFIVSGCATYRVSSNIESESTSVTGSNVHIIISKGALQDQKYEEIGLVEVTVKKLTAFHDDPTEEQANEALIDKARVIGADAVINVIYESGIGFWTWGYMTATGMGVKFSE